MKNKHVVLSLLLVIIWMCLITSLSSMNSKESNTKSKEIISNTITITNPSTTNNLKKQITNKLNLPFRKLSHMMIYFILSILVMNLLLVYKIDILKSIIIGFSICLVFSSLDEYHQTFVSGRSGKISDVGIDLIGSTLGISSFVLGYKKINKNNV